MIINKHQHTLMHVITTVQRLTLKQILLLRLRLFRTDYLRCAVLIHLSNNILAVLIILVFYHVLF